MEIKDGVKGRMASCYLMGLNEMKYILVKPWEGNWSVVAGSLRVKVPCVIIVMELESHLGLSMSGVNRVAGALGLIHAGSVLSLWDNTFSQGIDRSLSKIRDSGKSIIFLLSMRCSVYTSDSGGGITMTLHLTRRS